MARPLLKRAILQNLSRQRVREARALLQAGHAAGAYYLAGYAVECALKACIARKTNRYDFPDKGTVKASWTHDLADLVRVAGLSAELDRENAARTPLSTNWTVVKDWNEHRRYDVMITLPMAHDLLAAITRPRDGVLAWLREHW